MSLFKKTVRTLCAGEGDPACTNFTTDNALPPDRASCPECGGPTRAVMTTRRSAVFGVVVAGLISAVAAWALWPEPAAPPPPLPRLVIRADMVASDPDELEEAVLYATVTASGAVVEDAQVTAVLTEPAGDPKSLALVYDHARRRYEVHHTLSSPGAYSAVVSAARAGYEPAAEQHTSYVKPKGRTASSWDFITRIDNAVGVPLLRINEELAILEDRHPLDFGYTYQRARIYSKAAIRDHDHHHTAFRALAKAAQKAIGLGGGIPSDMLISMAAEERGVFSKVSVGHREWDAVRAALRNPTNYNLDRLNRIAGVGDLPHSSGSASASSHGSGGDHDAEGEEDHDAEGEEDHDAEGEEDHEPAVIVDTHEDS